MDEKQIMWQASMLEQQMQNAEQNLQFIDEQILELKELKSGLKSLEETKEEETFSTIGKGVYIKSEVKEKSLYIDVGSGIILKKTPKETQEIIQSQVIKLQTARTQLLGEIDNCRDQILSLVEGLRNKEIS